MPFYNLTEVAEELITTQHWTLPGRLVTGTHGEFAFLRFKANAGAKMTRIRANSSPM